MNNQLAGTGALLRLALRRDRVMAPVWTLVVAMLVLSLPGSLESVYGTVAERERLLATMTANGSLRALYGPVFGDSIGALTAWRGGVFAGLLAGVMSLVIVVRHTREEEESGRQELLSAAMVVARPADGRAPRRSDRQRGGRPARHRSASPDAARPVRSPSGSA